MLKTGFVLDFYERLLIRRALENMAGCAKVSTEEAVVLNRLDLQFADAEQVILHGLDLTNYIFTTDQK